MIYFKAEIERFESMGEKTGWSYVFIPSAIASQIKANCKVSFRVKGKIDQLEVSGMATMPMGEGDFIIALKGEIRKKLKKEAGANVELHLEEDKDFKIEMPEDLEICLLEETHLMANFLKQAKSHQNYYINWINQAKTETTRTKRITMTVTAMDKQQDFGAMMRESKGKNI
ncbi:YdeI/OmpD-associated family protein [Pedobacter punctiformis]|uniref:YdeI/OmpD-associated family protein n=1 Tax=Pedobacter punctiformis TaxID=3004097 RepID=A0ABT4L7Z5_9SPHI|nr:YdeI/OmpD-associated family protein [Pedobacter sp. HCMS5-2]MCZ4244015.1 YdeI/OmpD-associated family protein [Pedobacter sp. HCMS5-2]